MDRDEEIQELRRELDGVAFERTTAAELILRYRLTDESLRLRQNELQARLDRLEALAEMGL
jgi:hypothetical protein